MGGIVGRFFFQFGITVAFAVLVSLFVSFTLDPMLSAVWHDPQAEGGAQRGPIGRALAALQRSFDVAGNALSRRDRVGAAPPHAHDAAIAAGVVRRGDPVSCSALVGGRVHARSPTRSRRSVASRRRSARRSSTPTARRARSRAGCMRSPEVEYTYSTIGGAQQNKRCNKGAGLHQADADATSASGSQKEFEADIRRTLPQFAGIGARICSSSGRAAPGADLS